MIAHGAASTPVSIQKYGPLIASQGFTQHARIVEEFLTTLDLCPSERLLILILESYRWQAEQEVYPSVKTLAGRCKLGPRRVNQMTAHLQTLGLLIKRERFAYRSQLSNYYDLEPLYNQAAAWKDAEVAAALALEEALAEEPLVPADALEEAALIISEEFGEPEPRQMRYNVRRLGRRFDQHAQLEWDGFLPILQAAAEQTTARSTEQTRSGGTFRPLVPYFFSALDYLLTHARQQPGVPETPRPVEERAHPSQSEPTGPRGNGLPALPQASGQAGESEAFASKRDLPGADTAPAHPVSHPGQAEERVSGPGQAQKKSGILAGRARARKEREAAGRRRAQAPELLRVRIEAVALTFREKQITSAVSRAANLMADARVDETTMVQVVADARAVASRGIKVKNRMSYFFEVLERSLEQLCQQQEKNTSLSWEAR